MIENFKASLFQISWLFLLKTHKSKTSIKIIRATKPQTSQGYCIKSIVFDIFFIKI